MTSELGKSEFAAAIAGPHAGSFDLDGDGTVGEGDRALLQRLIDVELAARGPHHPGGPTLPNAPRRLEERWELVGMLGRGGQATTYLARDLQNGGHVAVKELDLGRVDDWKAIELFEREATALERLSHPGIPRYVAHFSQNTDQTVRFFLVQQFVPGRDLGDELQRGAVSEAQAVVVRDAVFDILEYLHSFSPPVVHRDIKPSNLLRTGDGKIVLVDFGAVQSAHAATAGGSTIVGTTGYMPMEQYMGRAVPASDLYALGATLLHMISGKHPTDLPVEGNRLKFDGFVRASAPFQGGLHALLEPAVERRVSTVAEARAAFDTALVAPAPPTAPAPRRRPFLIPLVAGALLLAYVGFRSYYLDPSNYIDVDNLYPEPPPNARKVLFVGNSHTYWFDQPRMVAEMVPKGQPPLWFGISAAPGVGVQWHVDNDVASVIDDDDWDAIMLQPQSLEPASNAEHFGAGLARFEKLVPKGTRSIVWVPWARDPRHDIYGIYKQGWSGGSFEELTHRLEKNVRTWVGTSEVCPIGEAWRRVRTQVPNAPIFNENDGNKATLPGAYLTGLMLYACIYRRDPAEVTHTAGLNPESAKKLRDVASATVKDYKIDAPPS